jgi:hypothetical protein
MKLEKFKEEIENQFITDYEKLYDFMKNINDILFELKIDNAYESYDEFCLEIEKYALKLFKQNNNIEITPKILTKILNDMIKFKIVDDTSYHKKLNKIFSNDDNILKKIKKIKK